MKMEGVMLSLIAGYLLTTFIIRKSNASCASTWLKANEAAFREEFAGVGLGKGQLFAMDGGDEAVSYATGRRAVEHVWTKVRTNGQDLLARLYHIVRGIIDYQYDSGSDKVVRAPVPSRASCPALVIPPPADRRFQACRAKGHAWRQALLRGCQARRPPQDP